MLPAALLSTHTGGFGKPAVVKLGAFMESAVSHWKENGINFDLIYVGYLGSLEAVKNAFFSSFGTLSNKGTANLRKIAGS